MIIITDKMLLGETRDELGKCIAELKRDTIDRISKIYTLESGEKVDFNYCILKTRLDVIEFLEYFLFDGKGKNWLCAVHPHVHLKNPIRRVEDFRKLLEDVKEMILDKTPTYDVRHNSMYFMVLFFLNRIEVKEDGT